MVLHIHTDAKFGMTSTFYLIQVTCKMHCPSVLQGYDVKIHVDAASGGFVAPFVEPNLKWDFRLKNVCSINVSGHK